MLMYCITAAADRMNPAIKDVKDDDSSQPNFICSLTEGTYV